MNQTVQQTPPTPAQRLAAKIRARTNDTRDILNLLHDIAQGGHDATEHDKLTATQILFDRGYGKCPKSAPDTGADPNPNPEIDRQRHGGDSRIAPRRPPQRTRVPQAGLPARRLTARVPRPCAPRRDPANPSFRSQSLPRTRYGAGIQSPYDLGSPDPFDDPSSIQSIIRDHIISITNDGDTLIDVLMDIAWPDDPNVKPFHRNKAGRMLLDRGAGTDPTPVLRARSRAPRAQPKCLVSP